MARTVRQLLFREPEDALIDIMAANLALREKPDTSSRFNTGARNRRPADVKPDVVQREKNNMYHLISSRNSVANSALIAEEAIKAANGVELLYRHIAVMLGVQPGQLHQWKDRYGLPRIVYPGRRSPPVRFDEGVVLRWAELMGLEIRATRKEYLSA